MPKRNRDFQKRVWGHAYHNLDLAMSRVLELQIPFDEVLGLDTLGDDYEPTLMELVQKQPHAKYALLLYTANRMINQAQQVLTEFATFAWGGAPDKVERWRNTGQEWRENQEDTDDAT